MKPKNNQSVRLSKLTIISEHKYLPVYLKTEIHKQRPGTLIHIYNWEEFIEEYLFNRKLPLGTILVTLFEQFDGSFSKSLYSFQQKNINENYERFIPPLDFLRTLALKRVNNEDIKELIPRILFTHIIDISNGLLANYINNPNLHFLQIPTTIENIIDKLENLPETDFHSPNKIRNESSSFLLEALQPHEKFKKSTECGPYNDFDTKVFKLLLADDRLGRPGMAKAFEELINQVEVVKDFKVSFQVFGETIADNVFKRILTGTYDLLILDKQFGVGEIDGETILQKIRNADPVQPVIIFTGKYADDIEKASRYGTQFDAAYFEKNKLLANKKLNKTNLSIFVNLMIERIQSVRNSHIIMQSKKGDLKLVDGFKSYEVMRWWTQRKIKEALLSNQKYSIVFVSLKSFTDFSDLIKRLKEFFSKFPEHIKDLFMKIPPQVGFGDFQRSCILLLLPFIERSDIFRTFKEFDNIIYNDKDESRKCFIYLPDDFPLELKYGIPDLEPDNIIYAFEYVMNTGQLINKRFLVGSNNFIHI